jgi:hypothetical protein
LGMVAAAPFFSRARFSLPRNTSASMAKNDKTDVGVEIPATAVTSACVSQRPSGEWRRCANGRNCCRN